jgi:hypothetical protein
MLNQIGVNSPGTPDLKPSHSATEKGIGSWNLWHLLSCLLNKSRFPHAIRDHRILLLDENKEKFGCYTHPFDYGTYIILMFVLFNNFGCP